MNSKAVAFTKEEKACLKKAGRLVRTLEVRLAQDFKKLCMPGWRQHYPHDGD